MSTVIFTHKGRQSLNIPLPHQVKDQQEKLLVERVLKANRGQSYLTFTHDVPSGMANPTCSFITEDPSTIKFLNDWNKRKKTLKIDMSLVPKQCPYCKTFKTEGGGDAGEEELNAHILEKHQKQLNERFVEDENTDDDVKAVEGGD